jgi:hypothetical protein
MMGNLLVIKDGDELVVSHCDCTAVTINTHSFVATYVAGIREFLDGIFFGDRSKLDVDANLFKFGHGVYLTFVFNMVWDVA